MAAWCGFLDREVLMADLLREINARFRYYAYTDLEGLVQSVRPDDSDLYCAALNRLCVDHPPVSMIDCRWLHYAALESVRRARIEQYEADFSKNRAALIRSYWDELDARDVAEYAAILLSDPAGTIKKLDVTSAGCRWLIDRFVRLEQIWAHDGNWCTADIAEALALVGCRPTVEEVRCTEVACALRINWLLVQPEQDRAEIRALLAPGTAVQSVKGVNPDRLHSRDQARKAMGLLIQAILKHLRDREETLRTRFEEPERTKAAVDEVKRDPDHKRIVAQKRFSTRSINRFLGIVATTQKLIALQAARDAAAAGKAGTGPSAQDSGATGKGTRTSGEDRRTRRRRPPDE
jgi:hypothetical protein